MHAAKGIARERRCAPACVIDLHRKIMYAVTDIFRRVHKIAKNNCLASSCLSGHPSTWNNSASTRRILMKFDI